MQNKLKLKPSHAGSEDEKVKPVFLTTLAKKALEVILQLSGWHAGLTLLLHSSLSEVKWKKKHAF